MAKVKLLDNLIVGPGKTLVAGTEIDTEDHGIDAVGLDNLLSLKAVEPIDVVIDQDDPSLMSTGGDSSAEGAPPVDVDVDVDATNLTSADIGPSGAQKTTGSNTTKK